MHLIYSRRRQRRHAQANPLPPCIILYLLKYSNYCFIDILHYIQDCSAVALFYYLADAVVEGEANQEWAAVEYRAS